MDDSKRNEVTDPEDIRESLYEQARAHGVRAERARCAEAVRETLHRLRACRDDGTNSDGLFVEKFAHAELDRMITALESVGKPKS